MANEGGPDQLSEALALLRNAVDFLLEEVEARYQRDPTQDQHMRSYSATMLRQQLEQLLGRSNR